MALYLCVDGGGSKTCAGLYDTEGQLLRQCEAGPANPLAYGDTRTLEIFCGVAETLGVGKGEPLEMAIGLAGGCNIAWRREFGPRLGAAIPLQRIRISSDMDPVLHANAPQGPAVMAIAGTGSSVLAKTLTGEIVRIGGRGTVFGDDGSGYGIAVRAMRAAAFAYDRCGPETRLLGAFQDALNLSEFNALTPWSIHAQKRDIARLSELVTRLAEEGDAVALGCVEEEARLLAEQIGAAVKRLNAGRTVPLFLNGGVVERNALFRKCLERHLATMAVEAYCPPPLHGHRAVLYLAQAVENPEWSLEWVGEGGAKVQRCESAKGEEERNGNFQDASNKSCHCVPKRELGNESEGKREILLDALNAAEIVRVMCEADASLSAVLATESENIALCVDAAAAALQCGGRIIYFGAGTSGRLGVLDASECPPTFGIAPERVVGVIAGGMAALTQSVEGAEDDVAQAECDADALTLNEKDFVLGIAASGTTPYTLAALARAKECGAHTALLCCNPAAKADVDILVKLDTGTEVLPGSTRLKAGTATKLALNIISTGAMARSGFIYRGRMVHMRACNEKLRKRAVNIVVELSGIGEDEARERLELVAWDIAKVIF